MRIEIVPIESIHENEDNPRLILDGQFRRLCKSIKEFPKMLQIRTIVVDEDNKVLGGNMRLRACKHLGMKEIPVIRANNLTAEEKKQFIVKDNSGFGVWDWDLLANNYDFNVLEDWGLNVLSGLTSMDDGDSDDEKEVKEPKQKQSGTSITIKFGDNYEKAKELIEFWQEKDADIGAFIVESLKREKDKLSIL